METTSYSTMESIDNMLTKTSIFNYKALIYILLTALSLVFYLSIDEKGNTLSIVVMTLVMCFGFLTIYTLASGFKTLVYNPTKSPVKRHQVYFECSEERLIDSLKQSDTELLKKVGKKHNGNMMLEILLSKDKQFAAFKIYRYVPYTYNPVSEWVLVNGDKIPPLVEFMN